MPKHTPEIAARFADRREPQRARCQLRRDFGLERPPSNLAPFRSTDLNLRPCTQGDAWGFTPPLCPGLACCWPFRPNSVQTAFWDIAAATGSSYWLGRLRLAKTETSPDPNAFSSCPSCSSCQKNEPPIHLRRHRPTRGRLGFQDKNMGDKNIQTSAPSSNRRAFWQRRTAGEVSDRRRLGFLRPTNDQAVFLRARPA